MPHVCRLERQHEVGLGMPVKRGQVGQQRFQSQGDPAFYAITFILSMR
jgi:hypothetical protein